MIDASAAERFLAAPLLAEVDRDIKEAILNSLVEARASRGAILLAQGQPNDHLTFLIDGSVEFERLFENGRVERITTLQAPAVFGTTSFFQPRPPTVTVRATSNTWMLSLYHPQHEALRRSNPRAAEALAVAVVRALSERFDLLDSLFTDYMAKGRDEPPRQSEWAKFRARLFEEQNL
jgi:CRP/FNR family cyclic AMP-dependent transcriptional regulator